MNVRISVGILCLALSGLVFAQQVLNNDSIQKMVKAGLGDDVIVSMIQSQPGTYNVTSDAMMDLKGDGVSNAVLAAMAAKGSAAGATSASASAASENDSAAYEDLDIGVYRKTKGQWAAVATEPVNWKTGGFLKSIATDGIVKGDVNGRIHGATSQTKMNSPLQFLIETPDGVEATDFQLVHLHQKSDAREFRTVTGGVFHASGGVSRDAVSFEQKKIARHTYEITLPANLESGEYAFLAAGLTGSTAAASMGKAYTFQLIE